MRSGIAAELVMVLCGIVLAWAFYILLMPTDARLASSADGGQVGKSTCRGAVQGQPARRPTGSRRA
jgi:hypothetical protein